MIAFVASEIRLLRTDGRSHFSRPPSNFPPKLLHCSFNIYGFFWTRRDFSETRQPYSLVHHPFFLHPSLASLSPSTSLKMENEAGPSTFRTPKNDQSEWSSSTTPSRSAFPRRLSLLSNPDSPAGHKTKLSTSSTSSTGTSDTPRRGKRTSLSYIASPSTAEEGPSLTRTPSGRISRATGRRGASQVSDAEDWLEDDDGGKSMGMRDSAKVENQFHDVGFPPSFPLLDLS